MIHYQLRCTADHRFDGWFRNSAAFDDQTARGLVTCPACGGTEIVRALMAPAVGRGRAGPAQVEPAPAVPAPAPQPTMGGALPDQVRAALQRLRAEVEKGLRERRRPLRRGGAADP